MLDIMLEVFVDAALDNIKLVPFLLVTYLLMEYLEHRTSVKTRAFVRRAGRLGPLAGSALGVFPQCGFSAAASNLYAGGIITTGTLIAVYLSTSDEMLPIFFSEGVDIRLILTVLGMKLIIGLITGFLVDFIFRFRPSAIRYKEIHTMCESEHCGCEDSIIKSALRHTAKIFVFLLIVSVGLNLLISLGGEDRLTGFMTDRPVVGSVLAGLVGLIPNCASSVVITQLFLGGVIRFGAMLSGLLVGAGVGLLVLFQTNRKWKENLLILAILYVSGVAWGIAADVILGLFPGILPF